MVVFGGEFRNFSGGEDLRSIEQVSAKFQGQQGSQNSKSRDSGRGSRGDDGWG